MTTVARSIIAAVLVFGLAYSTNAADVCPCIPESAVWTVTRCDTWNCSMSRLIDGNGDPQMFALPAGWGDSRWLVLRRVRSGSYIESPDNPYTMEVYDGMTSAASLYSVISKDRQPLLVTAPDGKVLVISLKTPSRQRPALH